MLMFIICKAGDTHRNNNNDNNNVFMKDFRPFPTTGTSYRSKVVFFCFLMGFNLNRKEGQGFK